MTTHPATAAVQPLLDSWSPYGDKPVVNDPPRIGDTVRIAGENYTVDGMIGTVIDERNGAEMRVRIEYADSAPDECVIAVDTLKIVRRAPSEPVEVTALRETCAHLSSIRNAHSRHSFGIHGPSVELATWMIEQSRGNPIHFERGPKFCNVGTDKLFGSASAEILGVLVTMFSRPDDETWHLFAPHLTPVTGPAEEDAA